MKLEVGMYVRTKKNGICKIESFASTLYEDYIENEKGSMIPKDEITKASHNIIDLIEVGDIVENQLGEIIKPYGGNIEELKDYWKIIKKPIKSIVTKEQFESMSYKVGD